MEVVDVDFLSEEVAPKSKDEWDHIFERAMAIAEKNLRPMMISADEESIPRQIMVIQLFTLAVNGLIHHDWTEQDILDRVSKHKFPKSPLEELVEEKVTLEDYADPKEVH